ncbi:MAG: hypothetical protein ACREMY_31620, partial [bacterium]
RSVCDELAEDGLIETWVERVFDYDATRYRATHPADTSAFTPEELVLVDWWVKLVSEKHTATSISQLSHDYGWEIARMGEELPPFAFLASRIRPPRSLTEHDWAEEEAKRHGLK